VLRWQRADVLPTRGVSDRAERRLPGEAAGCPFYISGPQFEYWKHTHLTVDVVPGRGSGFSVEAPEGVRFLIRSRLFTEDEQRRLAAEGSPPRGPQGT
jgi:uncharacterized protein (DUF779 family)